MTRTVEDILHEAKNRGLFLSNLFEGRTYPANANSVTKSTGEWRAAFSHPGGHRDEDIGASAAEALEETLTRAKGLKGPENRPQSEAPTKAQDVEVDDVI